jgi:hypothetical protein
MSEVGEGHKSRQRMEKYEDNNSVRSEREERITGRS